MSAIRPARKRRSLTRPRLGCLERSLFRYRRRIRLRSAQCLGQTIRQSKKKLGRLVSLVAISLAAQSSLSRGADLSAPALEKIRETVFRYQLEKLPWGDQGEGSVYFLSVEYGRDPTQELLKRFARSRFPVKPISAAIRLHEPPGSLGLVWRDRDTGERGTVYGISRIRLLSKGLVVVDGHYGAFGSAFVLRLTAGRWKVVDEHGTGVAERGRHSKERAA